jgi:hypothetical protein
MCLELERFGLGLVLPQSRQPGLSLAPAPEWLPLEPKLSVYQGDLVQLSEQERFEQEHQAAHP